MIKLSHIINKKIKITSTKNIHDKNPTTTIRISQKNLTKTRKSQMLIFLTNKCKIHNKK